MWRLKLGTFSSSPLAVSTHHFNTPQFHTYTRTLLFPSFPFSSTFFPPARKVNKKTKKVRELFFFFLPKYQQIPISRGLTPPSVSFPSWKLKPAGRRGTSAVYVVWQTLLDNYTFWFTLFKCRILVEKKLMPTQLVHYRHWLVTFRRQMPLDWIPPCLKDVLSENVLLQCIDLLCGHIYTKKVRFYFVPWATYDARM